MPFTGFNILHSTIDVRQFNIDSSFLNINLMTIVHHEFIDQYFMGITCEIFENVLVIGFSVNKLVSFLQINFEITPREVQWLILNGCYTLSHP